MRVNACDRPRASSAVRTTLRLSSSKESTFSQPSACNDVIKFEKNRGLTGTDVLKQVGTVACSATLSTQNQVVSSLLAQRELILPWAT